MRSGLGLGLGPNPNPNPQCHFKVVLCIISIAKKKSLGLKKFLAYFFPFS